MGLRTSSLSAFLILVSVVITIKINVVTSSQLISVSIDPSRPWLSPSVLRTLNVSVRSLLEINRSFRRRRRLCTLSKTAQPRPQSAPSVIKENIQSVRKHLILHRSRDICFSKMMQPQCPHDSLPMQQEKVTAEFVCVPSNSPKTKDWIHAIERMEEIPELSSMAASFSSSVSVSRSCSRGM